MHRNTFGLLSRPIGFARRNDPKSRTDSVGKKSVLPSLIALAVVFGALPATADAAISWSRLDVSGAGVHKRARELNLDMSLRNTSIDPAFTPEVVDTLAFASGGIRFNASANGVSQCDSRIPKNGSGASCPASAKVGGGIVTALLGTPGTATDSFGALSEVTGRYVIYNYRRRGTDQARLLAVIESKTPFAGVEINLLFRVTRKGALLIDIPELRDLPPVIRKSYPTGTKLVLTRLDIHVGARRERSGRPYLWRRWNNRFVMDALAVYE